MAKKNLLPGLPRVQKALKKASFTSEEFIAASQSFKNFGITASEFADNVAECTKAIKEYEKLSPEEKKKYREAEDQLQGRMDKTNYY